MFLKIERVNNWEDLIVVDTNFRRVIVKPLSLISAVIEAYAAGASALNALTSFFSQSSANSESWTERNWNASIVLPGKSLASLEATGKEFSPGHKFQLYYCRLRYRFQKYKLLYSCSNTFGTDRYHDVLWWQD